MKIDGRCHCGHIAYQAEVDPEQVEICHCTDCQTLSGSAFRTVVPAGEAEFKLLSGQPKLYVKTAESGAKRAQAFCPDCGTPIYSTAVGDGPKVYGIRLGTARQRGDLPPRTQYWARSAQHWIADIGSLPKVEQE
jgi:hypothetical protein